MDISIVKTPQNKGKCNYNTNQAPLTPLKLTSLPLGAVEADGWLKNQLSLMLDGITGRLPEYGKYFKPENNGWLNSDIQEGWEEVPYWLRGFSTLAILTQDERCLEILKQYIEAVIASQDSDGYFGIKALKAIKGKNGQIICDIWPHILIISALEDYYEYKQDERIMVLLEKFYLFCSNLPDETFIPPSERGNLGWGGEKFGSMRPFLQYIRAGDLIPRLIWFYNHTQKSWVIDLIHRVFSKIRGPWDEWLDHHVVNFTERFAYGGLYYQASAEKTDLDSVEYWYRQHMDTWGQMPGGIFAADERIRPGCVDPRQAFEVCAMVEFAKNFYDLGRITGDIIYADRAEEMILNHFPASMTPDLKGVHYLTAANQPQLDKSLYHLNRNVGIPMYAYTAHNRCCGHNLGIGWPYFIRNMWQATDDGGIAAFMYGPSRLRAKVGENGDEVVIKQITDYPFKGSVNFKIESADNTEFALYLRVPNWCKEVNLNINGSKATTADTSGKYICINRKWNSGDHVSLELKMPIQTIRWPRNASASIRRGPLYYSLKIDEKWKRCDEIDHLDYKGSNQWPNWEVLPVSEWNYALMLDEESDLQMDGFNVKEEIDIQPFVLENAPVVIKTRGKKVPEWGMQNNTVAELQKSPVSSEASEDEIELIPLCCARLRISCFPVAGDGKNARKWTKAIDEIAAEDMPKNRFDEMYKKQIDVGQQ